MKHYTQTDVYKLKKGGRPASYGLSWRGILLTMAAAVALAAVVFALATPREPAALASLPVTVAPSPPAALEAAPAVLPSLPPQPTYTPYPTYTAPPPTRTVAPSAATLYPTYTAVPTGSPYPTYTPPPTAAITPTGAAVLALAAETPTPVTSPPAASALVPILLIWLLAADLLTLYFVIAAWRDLRRLLVRRQRRRFRPLPHRPYRPYPARPITPYPPPPAPGQNGVTTGDTIGRTGATNGNPASISVSVAPDETAEVDESLMRELVDIWNRLPVPSFNQVCRAKWGNKSSIRMAIVRRAIEWGHAQGLTRPRPTRPVEVAT